MSERVIAPVRRGFLCLDSHPTGCARAVDDLWRAAAPVPPVHGREEGAVALVIGSSAGYGLAATVAGLARAGIRGIGVCSERAATDRRTASAGWYRTAAVAELARRHGRDMVFLNGDGFGDALKERVADLLDERFGGRLDYLIHSVAAPRRTDPVTGSTEASVLKPIGAPHTTKTLHFAADGLFEVRKTTLERAESGETERTVAIMGGVDWERWVTHLLDRRLLADGFTTTALSYVGSPVTAPVYRQGTIGAAKIHVENTATRLNERLEKLVGGRAFATVNGVAVTQSSNAIPGIALYLLLLRGVLGEAMVPPIGQMSHLWERMTGGRPLEVDSEGRVRVDAWELDTEVQRAVEERWASVTTDNLADLADLDWFRAEVERLFGFGIPGVDYTVPVRTDVPWSIPPGA
ncbi:enoyl-[acyl-carrier-protein] reductase FabV [Streptomyces sp. NPDC001137]|uniref:enoyl-[acyl-carrier-protein] reductase FabV n=1 Tax=Streptomyces sp. NPDC001137 TaxID=3154378 RepID=UPI00333442DF